VSPKLSFGNVEFGGTADLPRDPGDPGTTQVMGGPGSDLTQSQCPGPGPCTAEQCHHPVVLLDAQAQHIPVEGQRSFQVVYLHQDPEELA
jgi:hypothetical protein